MAGEGRDVNYLYGGVFKFEGSELGRISCEGVRGDFWIEFCKGFEDR